MWGCPLPILREARTRTGPKCWPQYSLQNTPSVWKAHPPAVALSLKLISGFLSKRPYAWGNASLAQCIYRPQSVALGASVCLLWGAVLTDSSNLAQPRRLVSTEAGSPWPGSLWGVQRQKQVTGEKARCNQPRRPGPREGRVSWWTVRLPSPCPLLPADTFLFSSGYGRTPQPRAPSISAHGNTSNSQRVNRTRLNQGKHLSLCESVEDTEP